jgi:hypothetical protein
MTTPSSSPSSAANVSPKDLFLWSMVGLLCFFPILWNAFLPAGWPYDKTGHPLGRDFINIWISGRLAMEGLAADLANRDLYFEHIGRLFGPVSSFHNWSYPPHALFLTVPFGAMGYGIALFLWLGLTLAACLFASSGMKGSLLLTEGEGRQQVILLSLLLVTSPAFLANLTSGQNGFLTAALLIGGFRLRERYPLLAGLCFAVLTIKPQLGILLPFLLMLEGRWKVIFSAGFFTLGLMAASWFVFGREPWQEFFTLTFEYQKELLLRPAGEFYQVMMPGLHMMLVKSGMNPSLSLALHWLVAIPVALTALYVWRKQVKHGQEITPQSLLLLTLATVLITPYGFNYDYVMVTVALLACLRSRYFASGGESVLVKLVWAAPMTVYLLYPHMNIAAALLPFTSLPVILLFIILCCRLLKESKALPIS